MSKTNEEKNGSARLMIGEWHWEDENANLTVEITDGQVTVAGTVKIKVKDEIQTITLNETFVNRNWWVDDYLFFTTDRRFCVYYADEKYLGFGEMILPGVLGVKKWGYKFERVE